MFNMQTCVSVALGSQIVVPEATANIARTDLFYKIARKSTSMLGDFTEQGFSDLVWSFAISSVFSKDLTRLLVTQRFLQPQGPSLLRGFVHGCADAAASGLG